MHGSLLGLAVAVMMPVCRRLKLPESQMDRIPGPPEIPAITFAVTVAGMLIASAVV